MEVRCDPERAGARESAGRPPGAGPGRREQLYEVSVFLFLIVPSMALSFLGVRQGALAFPVVASAVILRDLALTGLVLFFAWRNGEPFRCLGWTFRERWRDTALGAALFLPLALGAGLLDLGLREAGLAPPSTPLPAFLSVHGPAEALLALLLVSVVAVTEETVFRGYLILRLRFLSGSPAAAVVLSSLVFSLGHGYEGTAGVVTVGVVGAVLALVYLWRGSLVAPMVMHFLQDFTSIVVPALLGER
jgi:membrane protease YdiL (CAAX protease family)